MVNGMHIYSWPISAKVAEYGWNKRRISADRHKRLAREPGTEAPSFAAAAKHPQPEFRKVQESRRDFQEGFREQNNRSFAEAVRKNMTGNTETRVLHSDLAHNMSWFGSVKNEEWLMRSAVGELKVLNNIELVNKKLESRGFIFSSVYLGGKSIMWTFESVCERDGFIRNGIFWRECFSSMSCWKYSSRDFSRLKWVDVYGVPIDCWYYDFFRNLGGQVGETVWVDEETSRRARLDKGRILILASVDRKILTEIKVKGNQRVFSVRLEEDSAQVSMDWVNRFLGLNPPKKLPDFPNTEVTEGSKDRDDEEWGVSEGSRDQTDKLTDRLDDLVMVRERRPSRDNSPMEKGKGKRIPKLKTKSLWLPRCKGGVQIGLVRRRKKIQISEEESSSSGSGILSSHGPNFFAGKTSKGLDKGKDIGKGINLCIDLRSGGSEESRSSVGTIGHRDGLVLRSTATEYLETGADGLKQVRSGKSKSGRGLEVKNHPMKMRKPNPLQPIVSGATYIQPEEPANIKSVKSAEISKVCFFYPEYLSTVEDQILNTTFNPKWINFHLWVISIWLDPVMFYVLSIHDEEKLLKINSELMTVIWILYWTILLYRLLLVGVAMISGETRKVWKDFFFKKMRTFIKKQGDKATTTSDNNARGTGQQPRPTAKAEQQEQSHQATTNRIIGIYILFTEEVAKISSKLIDSALVKIMLNLQLFFYGGHNVIKSAIDKKSEKTKAEIDKKSEEKKAKKKAEKRQKEDQANKLTQQLQQWSLFGKLTENLQNCIMECRNGGADVENVFSNIPKDVQNSIKRELYSEQLKKSELLTYLITCLWKSSHPSTCL
ncbi:hypothetical protein Q3G72_002780 [Acer saccharum]|nr:hypothetical protein Q3G72_002780 [Acer saccharum]